MWGTFCLIIVLASWSSGAWMPAGVMCSDMVSREIQDWEVHLLWGQQHVMWTGTYHSPAQSDSDKIFKIKYTTAKKWSCEHKETTRCHGAESPGSLVLSHFNCPKMPSVEPAAPLWSPQFEPKTLVVSDTTDSYYSIYLTHWPHHYAAGLSDGARKNCHHSHVGNITRVTVIVPHHPLHNQSNLNIM